MRDDELVPPLRRGGTLHNPERTAQATLSTPTRLDKCFSQGWQAEPVTVVITRTFGETIRSPKRSLQRRAPINNGLVSHLHRYARLDVELARSPLEGKQSVPQSILRDFTVTI